MELDASLRLIAIERSGILLLKRQAVMSEICQALYTELSVSFVQINVVTATEQVFIAEWPTPKKKRNPSPLSNSGCREVVLAETAVVIPDSHLHPIVCLMPWAQDWRGYLGCPVVYEGQVLGALCVLTRAVRDWTEDEVTVVQKYADKVSRSL